MEPNDLSVTPLKKKEIIHKEVSTPKLPNLPVLYCSTV